MGIYREYNGTAKALVTGFGGVTTWTTNEINLRGNVLAFHLGFTISTQLINMISSIRVKMFGNPIVDVELDHLRAFIEATSDSNYAPAKATASAITIPMNLPSFRYARDIAARDPLNWRTACAFPVTAGCSIEIVGGGAAGFTGGSAYLGWTYTDMPPTYYRRLIKNKLSFAQTGTNQRYPINTSGELRGVILPTIGVARHRVVLNGIDAFNMPGNNYPPVEWDPGDDLLSESLRLDQGLTITSPNYIPTLTGMPAGTGSYLELDTNSALTLPDYVQTDALAQLGSDQIVLDELVVIGK